jgi:hypothetical protein
MHGKLEWRFNKLIWITWLDNNDEVKKRLIVFCFEFCHKGGCMLFAWAFLAPLGMIIARYYKFLDAKNHESHNHSWFIIHRAFMTLVLMLTLFGFFSIFYSLNLTWISSSSSLALTHSIFGIITILLVIVQVLLLEEKKNVCLFFFSLSNKEQILHIN